MKICYTVCTLNRLGQIRALAGSVARFNPEYRFFACLADEMEGRIDTADFPQINFISVADLSFEGKESFVDRYDPFELSCALKPYFGNYLLVKYNAGIFIYLDTDICVYDSFAPIEDALVVNSLLITSHFSRPVPEDGKFPLERDVLNSGLYNGGFVAFKNDAITRSFLSWWERRLFDQGYNNVCEGMMVDQLWLNLVPLYFKETGVLHHPGCNLAYWNLQERNLALDGDTYFVDDLPLIFFHFSGYRIDQPDRLSIHQNRIKEAGYPPLQKLLADYGKLLNENNFSGYLPWQPVYGRKKQAKKMPWPKKMLIDLLKKYGYALEKIRKV